MKVERIRRELVDDTRRKGEGHHNVRRGADRQLLRVLCASLRKLHSRLPTVPAKLSTMPEMTGAACNRFKSSGRW